MVYSKTVRKSKLNLNKFQIWAWYLSKRAFSESVFGCSTERLH